MREFAVEHHLGLPGIGHVERAKVIGGIHVGQPEDSTAARELLDRHPLTNVTVPA